MRTNKRRYTPSWIWNMHRAKAAEAIKHIEPIFDTRPRKTMRKHLLQAAAILVKIAKTMP